MSLDFDFIFWTILWTRYIIGGAEKLTGLETLVFEEQPTKPFRPPFMCRVKTIQVGLIRKGHLGFNHQCDTHRIHGTGIFTYMKTIKISKMWVNKPVSWMLWKMELLTDVLIFDSPPPEGSPVCWDQRHLAGLSFASRNAQSSGGTSNSLVLAP